MGRIWISGPPRSGTTMLNAILAGNAFLPECTVVTEFVRLFHYWKLDGDPRYRRYLGDKSKMRERFSSLIASILDDLPEGAVLKDPNLCLFLDDLRELVANPRVILILRDPRDVVASMLTVFRRMQSDTDVRAAINAVAPHYIAVEQALSSDLEHMLVYYRDIVVRDDGVFEKLALFCDRNPDASPCVSFDFDPGNPFHTSLHGKPVSPARVGAYKETLSLVEIAETEHAFSGVLARHFNS